MTAIRKYVFHDGKELELGKRTLVMGVLNVTPDSFSDGGKWNTHDKALRHMEEMVKDGADIIDIGAESSRPGFKTMPAQQEIERLMPFLEAVLKECPVPVSVDTFKAETAREAAKAGCHMLNDIWGLQYKEEPGKMAEVAAESGLPIIVMHNQEGKAYERDIIETMKDFFRHTIVIADHAGVPRNNLILDPGIQRQLGEIPAHQGEVVAAIDLPNAADALQRGLVLQQTTQGIAGVGRIDDDAAIADLGNGLGNQPRLRIFRMNGIKLAHNSSRNVSDSSESINACQTGVTSLGSQRLRPSSCHEVGAWKSDPTDASS